MTLDLLVETGARAGHRVRLDGARDGVIGRDPAADVRLDAVADRDASARHAALRLHDGAWRLRDLASTNGTWLNGRRIGGEVVVRDGDRIRCGADGPTILARIAHDAPRAHDASRADGATRRGRGALVALVLAFGAVAALGAVSVQRRADARVRAADAERRAADSARRVSERDVATLAGRLARADDAGAPHDANGARALDGASAAPTVVPVAAAAPDVAAAARRAMAAVALVAVEGADGTTSSGTAFGVTTRGLLATNRHVVLGADGRPPRRIAVKFANTDAWLEARLVRAHADADVATLQVSGAGPFPAVARIAAAEPAVGSEIVVVGFPATAEGPDEHALTDGVARAAAFRGHVAKVADGTVVIDAFAGRGSSGSPVLDARGAVVGVVYGGPRDAAGRVALAASSAALRTLLR